MVSSYRLIGYENRLLDARDFDDDSKDAGEIGAGHSVTALYEIVPTASAHQPEASFAELRLRYKPPGGEQSQLTFALRDGGKTLSDSTDDFRFAAAVAEFGMLLRGSEHLGAGTWDRARTLAEGAIGQDRGNYRREFIGLIAQAEQLR